MKLLLGCSALALLPAAICHAQTAPEAMGQARGGLEDIVVTAQKRAENIQDVPIAITAISGDTLQSARTLNTQSLQNAVPSLNYGNSSGFAMPFLRGIGSSLQTPGTEPSVATFVDGVYVASNQGVLLGLLGIDRVEVLAGPQGTLYGRNASGGAINLYTLTPSQDVEAKVTATYGNYDRIEGSGYISGPVTDRLAVGLYAAAARRDTFLDFVPRAPGQKLSNNSWGARLKAVWEPVDGFKLTGSAERLEQRSVDMANRNVQPNALGVTVGGSPLIKDYTVVSDTAQYSKPRTTALVLREEIDLGFADLVGITGYRRLRAPTKTSIDGTDAPLADVFAPIYSRQFSQEIQLLSTPDSAIKWIAGLFYFQEHGGYGPLSVHSEILFAGLPFNTAETYGKYRTKSYAAFAQVTVPLAEGLALTAGGRLTHDKKVKPDTIERLTLNGQDVGIPPSVSPGAKKSWTRFTPKITLEYKTGETLLYATYSKGFKSGQFNTSDAADITPVNPETLTDYEVGLKTDLFDRTLRLNIAAYYYDFKNLQVQILDPSGGGVAAVLRNAASARAYGLEATATVAVSNEFTIDLSGAFQDSKYKDFDDAPFYIFSPGGNSQIAGVSATGNDLIRAPRFVGTAGATYRLPLGNAGRLDLHGDIYYNDGFYWDPNQQFRQSSYMFVNGSITYVEPNERWSVQLWTTNLNNRHRYIDISATAPFGTYASDDAPRMYGVTASWKM